jgi:allantoate deiminase
MDYGAAAAGLKDRIDELAHVTDEPGRITRTFLSPAMARANEIVAGWMRAAGFSTSVDSAGNLRGWMEGSQPDAPVLLMGSHLDTVRNAGRYDGILGVLLPIVALELLRESGWKPSFSILHFGFSDEEGVRFQAGCLGSKAVVGALRKADFVLRDADGATLREALDAFNGGPYEAPAFPRRRLLGFVEAHIEQGPELERLGRSVAVVTGINAQCRVRVRFRGEAGHAGTVPMAARRDAFAGLVEFATMVERLAKTNRGGLVATIGKVEVLPGAGNVIPGLVDFSLDVRHPADAQVEGACDSLHREAIRVCEERNLHCEWKVVDSMSAVEFGRGLTRRLSEAVATTGQPIVRLRSGAGHDAMVLAKCCEAAMLFVRCRRGLSHHPDEFVALRDLRQAVKVFCEFLKRVGP